MLRTRLAPWLIFAILLFFAPVGFSQGGYTKEKYPEHGLRFEIARDYKWLALQPSEEWVILQWVNARSSENSRLQVIRIDYVGDIGPVTPGPGPREPEATSPKGSPKGVVKPQPINSWSRYLDQRLSLWKATEVGRGKDRDGHSATEYKLRPKGKARGRGWAYVWEKHAMRTFVVIGWSAIKDYDSQVKIWRRMAERMHFAEPVVDPEIEKLRRFYKRKPKLKDPEYRIRVRTRLDGKWKSEDTENYLVIYNTKDQPLVRRIVRDLESIRGEYMRLFPPAGEMDAVSTVRICVDKDEYHKFGGPLGSAGYWSSGTEELVFYDATKRAKGEKTDKLDTFIVLYHEAFHQFIHYSVGELAPHSWFNEGFGDYFSGAQIRGGRVKRVGPNRWRLRTIQEMIRKSRFAPWKDIVKYSQGKYYANGGANYAQGWSMVYFLNESRKVKRHKVWSKILPRYFDKLKVAWEEESEDLGAEIMDEKEMAKVTGRAQGRARKRALEHAFEGVDFEEIQKEWSKFTLSLRVK